MTFYYKYSTILIVRSVNFMYDEKLFLTPQEILDKEFKMDAKGYRPQEVDKFLDMVIRDYTEFINKINRLQQENKALENDKATLISENRKLRSIIDSAKDGANGTNYNNVDLLRRISNLEKVVYGKDNE